MQAAKEKPHVMDDFTINRVYEAHGTQLEDLWLYEEQLGLEVLLGKRKLPF